MSYKVLLTSVGGELAPYVINHLKNKTRHEIYLVGVDMSKFALGKDFCDKFYEVPPGNNKNFAEKIKEIVLNEKINLVIPASDEEALSLSYSKDEFSKISCNIASINYKDLEVLSDKYKTYNLLAKNNIHVPFYLLARNKNELIQAIDRIKIRDSKFVIKPTKSRGSRGVYIISEDQKELKECAKNNREKNSSLINFLDKEIDSLEKLYPVVVMEFLQNPIVDMDILSWNSRLISVVLRRRVNPMRPNDGHEIFFDKNLESLAKKIVKIFKLSWLYDCDIMFDREGNPCLLELNPRQSGSLAVSLEAGYHLLDDLISLSKGENIKTKSHKYLGKVIPYKSLKAI